MKLHWGTGIVITIIAFISFIMFFVVTMTTDKKYSHELVTEKYYQKELGYQQRIEANNNAKSLRDNITITKVAEGVQVSFPKDFDPKAIEGKVFLYRPSDKQLDFEMPISLSDTYLLVPDKRLLGGRWNITVEFTYLDTPYFITKELMY